MKASLPQLWGVLYAAPNKNGERKMCSNCDFFDGGNCEVLGMVVKKTQICGYHVEAGVPADPELAGLETVRGGTSCGVCRFFDDGHCAAVVDQDGNPAEVEPMGCCARWEEG